MFDNGSPTDGHYTVPAGGLPAWADADRSAPVAAQLDGGLPVQIVERRGDWGHVLCSNGWSGWVDARLLVALPPPMAVPSGPPTVQTAAVAPLAATVAPPELASTLTPAPPASAMPAPPQPFVATPPPPPPPPHAPAPMAAPPVEVPPPPQVQGQRPPWWPRRGWLAVVALLLVGAVLAISLLLGGGTSHAGDIGLASADSVGSGSFAPSIATPPAGSNGPYATTAPAPSSSGLVRANAGAPGLYAGVRAASTCTGLGLANFLEGHPRQAGAWSRAQGIRPNQIRPFIVGLTPASLRVDTRVTQYEFLDGKAVAKPAILQAGTAVLLDRQALPRVRCKSGNPLGAPRAVTSTPRYTGRAWPRFSPATTVVLDPAPGTTILVLIDPRTGLPFARVLGSVIVIDFDRPAAGAAVIVVEPGGPFTVTGTRFPPGAAITVTWDNPAATLATPTADGAGNFAITVNAPPTAAVGTHQVTINGGGLSVIQTVYVIPPLP